MTSPVSGSNSSNNAGSSSNGISGGSPADLQTTFLTLLITQLQNQDPTNPMDSSQMTSQLAQISTVSGISNLNSALGSLQAQLTATQQLQAGALIGRGVLADGNEIDVINAKDSAGNASVVASPSGLMLDDDASDVVVTVTDSNGKVVDTEDLGKRSKGLVGFQWDGKDSNGNQMPAGTYHFDVSAQAASGSSSSKVSATPLSYWIIDGIGSKADGTTSFSIAQSSSSKNISYSDIAEIL